MARMEVYSNPPHDGANSLHYIAGKVPKMCVWTVPATLDNTNCNLEGLQ
jgi:hypothetical protein